MTNKWINEEVELYEAIKHCEYWENNGFEVKAIINSPYNPQSVILFLREVENNGE